MNLPGSPRMHVWTGLFTALVGALIGGYAYTSWRIYYIKYLPVALFGLALLIVGSALAGYGQANRPRLGGRANADEEDEEESSLLERLLSAITQRTGQADDEEPARASTQEADGAGRRDPGVFSRLLDRARGLLASRWDGSARPEPEKPTTTTEATEGDAAGSNPEDRLVELDLECPECDTQFTASGQPPLDVACPSCGYEAEAEGPQAEGPLD